MSLRNFSDELYHYGVLGMKWGVRKDPKKALVKAYTKQRRLEIKADKAEALANRLATSDNSRSLKAEKRLAKAARLQEKADRYAYKGMKSWSARKGASYQLKASKYQMKASRIRNQGKQAAYRVYKSEAAAKKARDRAKKWVSEMDKVMLDASKQGIFIGQAFADAVVEVAIKNPELIPRTNKAQEDKKE